MKKYTKVLVPFYRGAVVFSAIEFMDKLLEVVLVPFYRGAVVFRLQEEHKRHTASSRPLLSRSGCIFKTAEEVNEWLEKFSSPFIEERLYFSRKK